MPAETTPTTTPTAPVAPVTAAPAASTPPPITTPSITPPKDPTTGKFTKAPKGTSPVPPAGKSKVSAAKALGLETSVKEGVQAEINKTKAAVERQTPTTAKFTEPVVAPEPPVVEPVAPVVEPPAPPAAPVTPPKVKLGDAEYTAEELASKLQELAALKAAPSQAPTPPKEPETPAAPAPTKEEIAAKETEWITKHASTYDPGFTEADLDLILTGGKEGAEKLKQLLQHAHASAQLNARKSIFEQLNPTLSELMGGIQPLVQQHQQLQRYQIEQRFVTKHADFAPHLERARLVAEQLAQRFPREVGAMTDDQFVDEVARQTNKILTDEHLRWFPDRKGDWRQSAVPVAAPSTPAVPTVTPAPPAAVAAPTPAATPAVRPPASNPPGGFPTGPRKNWDKAVASSLRD